MAESTRVHGDNRLTGGRLSMGAVWLAAWVHGAFSIAAPCSANGSASVSFRVTVPADTPKDARVFIAGNLPALGGWKADGLRLQRANDGRYQGAVNLPVGSVIEYTLTRGSWARVEKSANGGDVANRRLRVEKDQAVNVTVARWAEGGGPDMVRSSTLTGQVRTHEEFASRHLKNRRAIAVYLPPDYDARRDRRYPVLYLHDGQNVFDAATSFLGVEWQADEHAERLIKAERIEPLIIVGVYNNSERTNEYTPTRDEGRGAGGKAEAYARFLVEEVKPFVDRTYRTKPQREHTAVAGSSLGGLVSLYICAEYPQVFSMCGAISPALTWDEENWLAAARRDPAWMKGIRFWVDMGTGEGRQIEGYSRAIEQTRALEKVFDAAGLVPGREYSYEEVAGGEHNEASWAARFDRVLLFFFGK
jgi:predicted alpha/beta superfamily hydrolase